MVDWFILDGCIVKVTGMSAENWENVIKEMNIGDDCVINVDQEQVMGKIEMKEKDQ